MKFVKLKDLCDFEKGATGLAKAEPGDYPLVTTGAERKSCNTYQFDDKAVCIPLVSSTGHGHASLKNVHYQEGKFALGSILVALTSKDGNKLDIQFLHLYLSQLKDQVLVPLMSGAANVALSVKKIQNIEIPLPSIDRQLEIVERFKSIVAEEDDLKSGLTRQQNLLKKLRQQILQEAIEGKLTAGWRAQNPDVEPASKILKRIAAEKAQLVKEKKIKAQKPLLPITDEEKLFELPQGWEWCRLGHLVETLSGNNFLSTDFIKNDGVKCIKITNAGVNKIIDTDERLPHNFLEKYKRYVVYEGDIVLALTRPYIADGLKVSICPSSYDKSLLNQRVSVIRPSPISLDRDYCYLFLRSDYVLSRYKAEFDSKGQQPNLKNEHITDLIFPFPPRSEQQAIVTKVEKMLALCNQLEIQITQNQSHAEQLMQAVLKEAFSHNSGAAPPAKKSKVSADTREVIGA